MSYRVTVADLERSITHINAALGVPNAPYGDLDPTTGRRTVNVGCCHLAGAYGGYRVEQMCHGGGSRDLLASGYTSKRELLGLLNAWLLGHEVAA